MPTENPFIELLTRARSVISIFVKNIELYRPQNVELKRREPGRPPRDPAVDCNAQIIIVLSFLNDNGTTKGHHALTTTHLHVIVVFRRHLATS